MASKKTPGKPGNQTKQRGGEHHDVPASIFSTPGADIVAGELILQLDESAGAAVTESITHGPSRGQPRAGALRLGHDSLDRVLAKLKVTHLTRLHPPAPAATMAMSEAVTLAGTYRVGLEHGASVEAAVKQLQQVAGVQYAEAIRYRETFVVPNDPSYPSQWGLSKINCPAAWDRTTGSPNIVVAVIDTGVDLDHPELAPLLVPGFDMVDLGASPTAPPGFHFEGDFQGRDNNPQDEVGHGTHVAGTIACLSNNGSGVAGVTWQCRLMPVRVLARVVNNANASDVRGSGSSADIAAGIRWAVDNGARVINLSLGGPSDTQVERDAIAYAVAHNVVVCAAMGNGGPTGPTSFPGAYPNVVAVGAIDAADHRAGFSQVGPHIDVVGPGVGVLSTVWNNSFTTMSGTSMATPHVAGVAALVLSCNPSLTAAQVADILRQTARPLRTNPADPVPNNQFGFGCVDAQAALARACPPPAPSRTIICRPSVAIACPSAPVLCPPHVSTTIACRPSVVLACKPSVLVLCPPKVSLQITCPRPSAVIACPSALVACPSGVVCGPINPVDPGPLGGAASAHGCQCQDNSASDWNDADPWAGYYPGEGQ